MPKTCRHCQHAETRRWRFRNCRDLAHCAIERKIIDAECAAGQGSPITIKAELDWCSDVLKQCRAQIDGGAACHRRPKFCNKAIHARPKRKVVGPEVDRWP